MPLRESVNELIRKIGDEDSEIRVKAREELIENGEKAVIPLISALRSDNLNRVKNAARVLGELDDPAAVEPLIALLGASRASIRNAASKALAKMDSLPQVLEHAKDADARMRRAITRLTPEYGDPSTVDALAEALRDPDPLVRRNAARALGLLDAPGSVKHLSKALRDGDWRVRQWAAYSLGLITRKTGATRRLKKTLNDENRHVRAAAATALGDNRIKGAVNRLLVKMRGNDPLLRDAAVSALGYIGSRKAVSPLVGLYPEAEEHTQTSIIYALARIGGSEETYSLLEKTIENPVHAERTMTALRLIDTQRAHRLRNRYLE